MSGVGGGYAQYTTTGSAFGLATTPDAGVAVAAASPRAQTALLHAEAQNVRWRDDGTNPTTAVGMILYAGQVMLYDGDLTKIKFIAATAGAILNVSYYA